MTSEIASPSELRLLQGARELFGVDQTPHLIEVKPVVWLPLVLDPQHAPVCGRTITDIAQACSLYTRATPLPGHRGLQAATLAQTARDPDWFLPLR